MRKFGNGTEEATLYDKAGRVTVKMQKNERGKLLWGEGYVYGSDGKRTATVDNSGRVTLYEYNKKGQLETIGSKIASFFTILMLNSIINYLGR